MGLDIWDFDTWKPPKGQEAGEWVTKKCGNMGQCIPGLKARLVSASAGHRGQPAGLRSGTGADGEWSVQGVPRLAKLA